ncbi:MAG: glycosyltransferase [Alphaproteobacteria bacterium]
MPTSDSSPSGDASAAPAPQRIAVLLNTLAGGGVERVCLTLATAFAARGYKVDLVVCRDDGRMTEHVPASVRLVRLPAASRWRAHVALLAARPGPLRAILPLLLAPKPPRVLKHLPAFVRYLDREQPEAVLSAFTPVNLMALWANRLAGTSARLVVSEHETVSAHIAHRRYRRTYPALIGAAYGDAAGIVAVSTGIADDLARIAGLSRARIAVVHNPIPCGEIAARADGGSDDPWLMEKDVPPLILGVGRLAAQKDFATLIRAFARLRAERPARLAILGEGRERTALERLARTLGVANDVRMPGYVAEPFVWMARAAALALSSRQEGFGNVLVEAMACGCPVVSTDCPSGPREILADGEYGPLVPVGDAAALARAIAGVLDAPPTRARLRARAADFDVASAADAYLGLLAGASP